MAGYRKGQQQRFNISQIKLPSHLSMWPNVKTPEVPKSASRSQPSPTRDDSSHGSKFDSSRSPLVERKQEFAADRSGKEMFSSSDHDIESDAVSSDEETSYDSAPEDVLVQERGGSNLTRKPDGPDDLSSGEDDPLTNDAHTEDDDEVLTKLPDGEQLVSDNESYSSGIRARHSSTERNSDECVGKQKHRETDGAENVFNAHSPMRGKSRFEGNVKMTPIQFSKPGQDVDSFTTPNTSKPKSDPQLRKERHNASNQQSPATLPTKLNNNVKKDVPIGSALVTHPQDRSSVPQSEWVLQKNQANSAALTEAQLQADLLKRGSHREFSSSVFTSLSDEEDGDETNSAMSPGTKKRGKKRKHEESILDPVEAEITKQQMKYKDYIGKRKKENPDYYLKRDVDVIHELTSEGSAGVENEHQGDAASGEFCGNIESLVGSRSESHGQVEGSQVGTIDREDLILLPSKKRKKRNRDKRKRAGKDRSEFQSNKKNLDRLDQPAVGGKDMARTTSKSDKHAKKHKQAFTVQLAKKKSLESALLPPHQSTNARPASVMPADYSTNAEFKEALKSLWPIIPKALLRSTMKNLNKAHCVSLQAKLELCKKGKYNRPNVRVVERTNEKGEKIDLLEDNGVVIEPDPHTMSSDLTLLTAARDLIVLLSRQKVDLDLTTLVANATHKGKSASSGQGVRPAQGQTTRNLPLEEQLRRIAEQRQQEIEKLREESRTLNAKIKKLKG